MNKMCVGLYSILYFGTKLLPLDFEGKDVDQHQLVCEYMLISVRVFPVTNADFYIQYRQLMFSIKKQFFFF